MNKGKAAPRQGKRRRFADEYKSEAVARLDEPGATYASVAAELGLTSAQLKTWSLELAAAGSRCLSR